jgi:peptidoglycan/LPS O-acetylase OafA/YrhL
VLIVFLSDMTYRLVERPLRSKGVGIARGMSDRFAEERAAESLKTPPAA